MIKVVLCDVGGVRSHSDQTFTISALVGLGIPYDLAKKYFNRPQYLELARGKISLDEYWQNLGEEYGTPDSDLALQQAHMHHVIEANQEMIDLLGSLDVDLMLVTDTVKPEFDRYRELLGILDYPVWRSDKAGLLKRDQGGMAHVYEWAHMCIHEELSPSEILFIDDSEQNCRAAVAYGLIASCFISIEALTVELTARGLL